MTRHVHLDLVGGIAGDMFIAAMLDAFPHSKDQCFSDLHDSGVLDQVNVALEGGKSHGLRVQRFQVSVAGEQARKTGQYSDLKAFLLSSHLDDSVKRRALSLLRLLAEAESEVHGVALHDVHFHEVADWDSLTDVVAASSVIERNQITRWSCSAVPAGSGLVQTEHGKLPVPAPATLYLLRGFTLWDDGEAGERVTPTGAAILKHVMTDAQGKFEVNSRMPMGVCLVTGTGAGTRELRERPNILRCAVIDADVCASTEANFLHSTDEVDELTFAIDDMTPEELAVSLEHIRAAAGVLDISSQLAMGKKGRAVFNVTVLCEPAAELQVSKLCFAETTTLGLRVSRIMRRVLHRQEAVIEDDHGVAHIKLAHRPEHDSAKVASDDLQSMSTLEARRARAIRIRSRARKQ